MKIIYFGTDVFLPCFKYLADEHEILKLYTYHADEDYFTEYAIVKEAAKRGIPVSYEKPGEQMVRDMFQKDNCDLLFLAEYAYILPIPDDVENFRGVNLHSSLLPQGRGYYPIECAMERGEAASGLTMHVLAQRFDTGGIIYQSALPIKPETDSVDIYLYNSASALEMTKRLMANLETDYAAAAPMAEITQAWPCPAEVKRILTHNMTISECFDVFRSYNSMTEIVIGERAYHIQSMMPGTAPILQEIIFTGKNTCLFALADGHLRLVLIEEEEQ